LKTVEFVVPLLNEAANISLFKASLDDVLNKTAFQCHYLITFIDDGSSDNSWNEICQLASLDTTVKGLRFSRNFGKEYAIEAGLKQSTADAVIVIDADLQHPISLVPTMIEAWQTGQYQVVSGVKAARQKESRFKSLAARAYYFIFNKMSGLQLQQMTDFKLLDRNAIDGYLSLSEGSRFFRGLVFWLGYKEMKLEFVPLERIHGASSWSLMQLYRYAKDSLISFSYIPLKLTSYLSLGMLVFALLLTIQSLFNKFSGDAQEGFTTVIIVQLVIGCSIMFGLSNIGTYLAKIYDEIKSRPHYIVSEKTARHGQAL
jgi:polyisoprenyl-phosphate glycosyltransferase